MITANKNAVFLLIIFVLTLTGCMRFTQKDYDLQEKAYQKERQQEEMKNKDRFQWPW